MVAVFLSVCCGDWGRHRLPLFQSTYVERNGSLDPADGVNQLYQKQNGRSDQDQITDVGVHFGKRRIDEKGIHRRILFSCGHHAQNGHNSNETTTITHDS